MYLSSSQVNFCEPLSMLQRVTESFEYSDILDKAALCTDPCEQMAYVAAFTISIYASTSNRTGKPFNPLLGETFECDRTSDLGWRAISEQVNLAFKKVFFCFFLYLYPNAFLFFFRFRIILLWLHSFVKERAGVCSKK